MAAKNAKNTRNRDHIAHKRQESARDEITISDYDGTSSDYLSRVH